MNRLAEAMSPYLLQHADNPVHWWEWGEEAFAEARRRDVPLLISVGYAACHWCHVMAHESFEDDEVARLVNEHTVPVKVDREERPDVDAVYMTATQAMTGQGGWPMTVFATPDGHPFFCGTYFPKPNFVRLVQAVSTAWRDQREAVLNQGRAVTEALEGVRPSAESAPLSAEQLDAAAARLHAEHDRTNGGFGDAPKFPPGMCLEFLLRHHARTGAEQSLEVVRHTCERMARGGMYDQLTGGFARYSVDAAWVVPHFEKMLYDNALLLRVYSHLWRATGDPLARRVATDTAWFLVSELATTEGGFASALDADTDGVEGATYVWTPAQLRDVLGEADADWAAELFQVTDTGTFEHGTSVLQLPADPDDPERFRDVVGRLLETRRRRPQPARDDKVVASWNGLAVTALLEFSNVCGATGASYKLNQLGGESELSLLSLQSLVADAYRGGGGDDETTARVAQAAAGAAYAAAELLARLHLDPTGRLRRVSRDGRVGESAGILEDYGAVAEAFCAMHQASGEGVWLERAGGLLDAALERFAAAGGGFFDTADDAERLVSRPADPTDNATPSGLTSLATALIGYAALTGSTRYRDAAAAALATVGPLVARHARFTGWACAAGEALLAGPLEIAIAMPRDDHWNLDPLVRTAWLATSPGAVVVVGEPGRDGVPLLADRPMVDGKPTAYVCRDFTCDLPVVSAADLERQLT